MEMFYNLRSRNSIHLTNIKRLNSPFLKRGWVVEKHGYKMSKRVQNLNKIYHAVQEL